MSARGSIWILLGALLWGCHTSLSGQSSQGTAQTASVGPARKSGQMRRDAHGVEQVWVTPGVFSMGTDTTTLDRLRAMHPPDWVLGALPSESPEHTVMITKGFWIDRTEVTNASFDAFVEAGGYSDRRWWSEEGWAWRQRQGELPVRCVEPVADHPRVCVTWYEASAYAAWRGGRLPYEAEWEFAARGTHRKIYPWGDEFDSTRCNVVHATGLKPVGSYPNGASWVGAQDMAGNAMEWVQDWLEVHYYETDPVVVVNPRGPEKGRVKVERGGWWGSNPFVARTAYRHFEDPPDYQDHHIGFRIVSPAESEKEWNR